MATTGNHDFDMMTFRCKRCGMTYLALMGGGYVSCKPLTDKPEKEPLKGDALWDSIVDTARGS